MKAKSPVFSIILVTYKRIGFLREALASIQCQNFEDYECLIFNDWPIDNKEINDIITSLNDSRFQFFHSEYSFGANHWRNQGIQYSKGKYIAFLDDDDQWFKEKLQEHYKAHVNNDSFFVFSDYIKTWPNQSKPDMIEENPCVTENLKKATAQGKFSISTTSCVSLKNDLPSQLFDETLLSFQDWDAWFNLISAIPAVKFIRIAKPLIFFTQHDNERVSKNYKKRLEALSMLKKKYVQKDIDISGFIYKERLNLIILSLEERKESKVNAALTISKRLIKEPRFFKSIYTYKRIGRFLFKNNK